jgi:hypothetical protein
MSISKSDPKRLLDTIKDPEDIRRLDLPSLGILAQEIRELIVETVSRTGGHLASSLGAVELPWRFTMYSILPRTGLSGTWDIRHMPIRSSPDGGMSFTPCAGKVASVDSRSEKRVFMMFSTSVIAVPPFLRRRVWLRPGASRETITR